MVVSRMTAKFLFDAEPGELVRTSGPTVRRSASCQGILLPSLPALRLAISYPIATLAMASKDIGPRIRFERSLRDYFLEAGSA